ncbi:hypothetical protein FFZ77_25805 [Streptomyces katsurahamanus]|uniref:Uncharacterized protein n=1 Tax=Streptomyces katsurahamanus TaxID=2577098 RepID=A0ABW9NZY0_9ACTN|nr:hypothetical protein [Streptomyces katsurahamanus]
MAIRVVLIGGEFAGISPVSLGAFLLGEDESASCATAVAELAVRKSTRCDHGAESARVVIRFAVVADYVGVLFACKGESIPTTRLGQSATVPREVRTGA